MGVGVGGHATVQLVEMLLYVHTNSRFIRDGSPGRPPRLSHSSRALVSAAHDSTSCLSLRGSCRLGC